MNFKDKSNLEYVDIADRVKMLHEKFPGCAIITDIVHYHDLKDYKYAVVVRCTIYDKDKNVLTTGHAREVEGSSEINKTSFLENAETSALGRAIGNLGIGSSRAIASKEEVEGAVEKKKVIQKLEALTKADTLNKQVTSKEVDYSYITDSRTDADIKRWGVELKKIGVTASVLLVKFNRMNSESGKYKGLSDFFKKATKEEIISLINGK